MKASLKTGFSFGLTSGIITTLGLMVGLYASTKSKMVVMGGVLTIAVADSFSDALGIHISEETKITNTQTEVWEATISTFFFKFIFATTFIIPLLLFNLKTAVIVSIIWGFLLLAGFSFYIGVKQKINPYYVIFEHILISSLVIIITTYIGKFIALKFG